MNPILTPATNNPLILVFGSITCDIPYWPSQDKPIMRGEKNKADRIELVFGGFGLNASVALRHAFPEFRVRLNSCVGNQKVWGRIALWDEVVKPYLESEGVELSVHVVPKARMPVSIIEVKGDERTIFTQSDPKAYFNQTHIVSEAIPRAQMVLIGHLGIEVTQSLIQKSAEAGVPVVLNPGRTQFSYFAVHREVFHAISEHIFALQMNRPEARKMLEMPTAPLDDLLHALAERGQQVITVLTDGARGALAYDRRFDAVIEQPACSIPKHKIVDTTGAGDHTVAVLAGALLQSGGDLKSSLAAATIYAGDSTRYPGGCGGELRKGGELDFLDTHRFKGDVRIRTFADERS